MLCRPPGLSRRRMGVSDRAVRGALPDPVVSEGATRPPGRPERAGRPEGIIGMAHIVMADDGIPFDGTSVETGPLGGAETAFVALAEAFAARGHRVEARSKCRAPVAHNGVTWAPLASAAPDACDLLIANRGARLLGLVPRAGRRLFWLHNPARYLKKPRNLWPLARYRPTLVLCGRHHADTVPGWLP